MPTTSTYNNISTLKLISGISLFIAVVLGFFAVSNENQLSWVLSFSSLLTFIGTIWLFLLKQQGLIQLLNVKLIYFFGIASTLIGGVGQSLRALLVFSFVCIVIHSALIFKNNFINKSK